jgi:hypothetical protein
MVGRTISDFTGFGRANHSVPDGERGWSRKSDSARLTRVRHAFTFGGLAACNLIRMPSRLVRPISQPATRSKLFKILSCSLPRIGDYYFIRHV